MIRPHCPKPFCVYHVPACCHGNAVQDLNTSLCLPPCFSFILPPTPLQGLTSLFIQLDDSLTVLSLPSFLWSVSHSLSLTLPAKWNLANCFLLLIPWLCANKTHTQCKLAFEDTETNYMLSMQTCVKLLICVHLPTLSDTQVAILN